MAQAYQRKRNKKLNVRAMVQLFGKTRQWYYKLMRNHQKRESDRLTLLELIRSIRIDQPRIGGPKLYGILKHKIVEKGIKMGRDKFTVFMRQEGLLVRKRKNYVRTTQSYHRYKKYKNLIANLKIKRPEQVWVSDITYIRTKQGFMYLSLITDAYSKKIVGYYLSPDLKTESVLKALKQAIKNRMYPNRKLIHHSDRGIQYCAPIYTSYLENNGIEISMTTKYDPYENAIAERVNGILKGEFYLDKTFHNARDAQRAVRRTIEVYNTKRPHYSCKLMVPEQAHISGKYELKKWSKNFPLKGTL